MSDDGMMLFVKQAACDAVLHVPDFAGSLIHTMLPFRSRVCEKSPARSSAVGTRWNVRLPGSCRGSRSCETKKNSLSCLLLKSVPGSITGPPSVHAVLLYLYGALSHCARCAAVPSGSWPSEQL